MHGFNSLSQCSVLLLALLAPLPGNKSCQAADQFDILVRGGAVYDGSGGAPREADVGIKDSRINAIGDLSKADAKTA